MADVQVAGWVREHRLDEPLWFAVIVGLPTVDSCVFPIGALLRLDDRGFVSGWLGIVGRRGRAGSGIVLAVHSVIRLV